jgi:hypothetical protein
MEDFIALLIKNLERHNYPQRKVSFDLVKLYESADQKNLSLNKVLDVIKERGVDHEKTREKIIFFPVSASQREPQGEALDLLDRAKEMMASMGMDEQAAAQAMVEERLKEMSEEERNALFEQIKSLGLG